MEIKYQMSPSVALDQLFEHISDNRDYQTFEKLISLMFEELGECWAEGYGVTTHFEHKYKEYKGSKCKDC